MVLDADDPVDAHSGPARGRFGARTGVLNGDPQRFAFRLGAVLDIEPKTADRRGA